jgi:hypothetical protein
MMKLSYDEEKVSRKNKASGRMRVGLEQAGGNGLGSFVNFAVFWSKRSGSQN